MSKRRILERIKTKMQRALYPLVPSALSFKKGRDKDIILLASRRSGSTHLSWLLAYHQGIRLIDQPLAVFQTNTQAGKIKRLYLPAMPYSQFISLSPEQEILVYNYVSMLLRGKLKPLGEVPVWDFPFLSNRTVIKECDSLPLIDWFNKKFDVSIIYLTRHPISQSLSVVRNKWGITADAYLKNEIFSSLYLSAEKIKLVRDVLSKGTYFDQAMVNWCLENLVPLKYRKSVAYRVTYEELALNPRATIEWLSGQLNLPHSNGVYELIKTPSQSALSDKRTKDAIREGEREYLINKWQKMVSPNELDSAKYILGAFDIYDYRVDESRPASHLIYFPNV